ncbi:DinI family protein [Klebsiella pneumoniae]|uniref:DinI family protein n=1 Tax=Klebsiella pneumoniae TaxID=573 RepID=UPI000A173BF1|nr:DinI family protein [Klebsiella pneumoniae]MBS8247853.1 DinI family protein [Klebsiella pneumoniae]OSC53744.1 DinI family protein [Klebsiella pneumoniae]
MRENSTYEHLSFSGGLPTLDALESELYRNLRPLYPKTVIRIRKGSSNGVELTGLQLDEERKQVMKIMQKVWEDDSWLH